MRRTKNSKPLYLIGLITYLESILEFMPRFMPRIWQSTTPYVYSAITKI